MTSLSSSIKTFNKVQALSYRLNDGTHPACNCATKAKTLAEYFSARGIEWRYVLVHFSWAELGVPAEILKLRENTLSVHKYLEVRASECEPWLALDATWDPALKNLFPIASWDGLHATEIAVPVKHRFSETEVEAFTHKVRDAGFREMWLAKYQGFFVGVNDWLQDNRV